jgi:regulator of nonsense transcripts 2
MSSSFDPRRKELLRLNRETWEGCGFEPLAKLDSSLKKNTAFIKKVRTSINAEQYKSLLKDIETVSLEKYLSEIISSLSEGITRVSKAEDILAATEVISLLHQRFHEKFTPYLLINILLGLSNPVRFLSSDTDFEKEEAIRITRQKNLLRLLGELVIVGVFRTLNDCPKEIIPNQLIKLNRSQCLIVVVLKDLLSFEINLGNSLGMVQAFLKRFQHLVFKEKGDDLDELILDELREILQLIFTKYTEVVIGILIKKDATVRELETRNKKASIRTGKILETLSLEKEMSSFEGFQVACEYLATTLKVELPDLKKPIETETKPIVTISVDEPEIWQDPKERDFYTKIPIVDHLQPKAQVSTKSDGEQVFIFLEMMENIVDQDLNELTTEFNQLKYNKATKNRLFKFFTETTNLTNLKYYSKFLKINQVVLSDLIEELVEYLDIGFRSQIHHTRLNFKNIYFFIEFTKFKLIPEHVIFHKIRRLTLNVSVSNNLDILDVLYQNIGRFLMIEPEYKDLMKEMVELLEKQKNLNDKLVINNLLAIVNPTTKKDGFVKVNKTPLQLFIYRLLRVELNPTSQEQIVSHLKMINIRQEEEEESVLECFSEPHLLNFDNIPSLAKVLHALSEKDKRLFVKTIDNLVENVVKGLELNDYRLNRIRMSHIKFIAEIYNLGSLNFKFLIDLAYKILCLGHPNNQPFPMNTSVELDLPDNYFRIQLCCFLFISIKSIGVENEKKTKKKKKEKMNSKKNLIKLEGYKDSMKTFLTFLQYYIFCKHPLPIEIEFMVSDLFIKFVDLEVERFNDLSEAIFNLQRVIEKRRKMEIEEEDVDVEEDEEDDEEEEEDDEDDDEEEDDDEYDDEDDEDDDDDDDDYDDEVQEEDLLSSEDEAVEEEVDIETKLEEKKFDDELEREFQKMVLDSYGGNKVPTKLNVPMPSQVSNDENGDYTGKVRFGLLTKQGKKTNIKQLSLPIDNKFAASVLKERQDEKQHREKIMKLVLNMNE